MRKEFLTFIVLLFLVLIAALISWPTRWMNLDIGSIHYHKLWEGPNLSDLTFGKFEYNFDIDLGRDFRGSTEYKVKVSFDEGEEDKEGKVKDTVSALRERLHAMEQYEGEVVYYKDGEDYYIRVEVAGTDEEFDLYKNTLLQEGNLEIWGEKTEDLTEDDSQQIQIGEGEDPFRSFIEQSYQTMGVDANDMKGITVAKEEDSYYIRVFLSDLQAEQLLSQIELFYGKRIVAILDSQILFIDGGDLGDQIQYYRKVNSVKIAGFYDRAQADLISSVIRSGPLSTTLEIVESNSYEAKYDINFISESLVREAIIICLLLLLVILFKWDGLMAVFMTGFYYLFVLAGLKISPFFLTEGTLFAFLFSSCIFFTLLSKILVIKLKISKNEAALTEEISLKGRDQAYIGTLLLIICISLILSLFIPVWFVQNVLVVIFISVLMNYLVLYHLMPFSYKFINLFKREAQ